MMTTAMLCPATASQRMESAHETEDRLLWETVLGMIVALVLNANDLERNRFGRRDDDNGGRRAP